MPYRLSDFASLGGLQVVRDGVFERTGKLSTPLDGLCVPLRTSAYLSEVNSNYQIAAVITTSEIADGLDSRFAIGTCSEPDAVHSEIHAEVARSHEKNLRASLNRIDNTAKISASANIEEYGVQIGPRCWIGPNVTISAGVTVEADCVLHSGISLGVPAFNTGIIDGRRKIVPQVGGVRLAPHVEMLANCAVARAVFGGETTIGEETVSDNLVYIAHDVQIGRRVQICALVNILGRTVICDEAYIGPSAVIKNGLRVGGGARVSIGAVVTQDVPEGATVSGNFAIPHETFIKHLRSIR